MKNILPNQMIDYVMDSVRKQQVEDVKRKAAAQAKQTQKQQNGNSMGIMLANMRSKINNNNEKILDETIERKKERHQNDPSNYQDRLYDLMNDLP